ncbi:MAG: hypothetical protein K2J70_05435, partial [Muribaculaceae bacterium]|nr:hypothetical protein [Muribaculaceae bacterium]
ARSYYLEKKYSKAMIYFKKAQEVASECDSLFWEGMACRGISDIFHETFDSADELNYAKMEYNLINKSGREPYARYAMFDLARAYASDGQDSMANIICGKLKEKAREMQDSYLNYLADQLQSVCYFRESKYDKALKGFETVLGSGYGDEIDSLYYGSTLLAEGRIREAEELLGRLESSDSPMKRKLKADLFKERGNYEEALVEWETIHSMENEILRASMNEALATAMNESYEIQNREKRLKIKNLRLLTWLSGLILILVILLFTVIIIEIRRKHRRDIDRRVAAAQELEDIIAKKDSKTVALRKLLFSSRNNIIEEISQIFITNKDTKAFRRRIADSMTAMIEQFSSRSERIRVLESDLDESMDNIISDFKKDFPGLKEVDYRLFLFSVMGWSAPTIALFLKEDKVEAVYNRKRRIKDKIRCKGEDRFERYIEAMR